MITARGFIKRTGWTGRPEAATLHETRRSGMEYARLPDGLLLLPSAYEEEEVLEIDSDEDEIVLPALPSLTGNL